MIHTTRQRRGKLLLVLTGLALACVLAWGLPLAAAPAAPLDDCAPDIYEPDNTPAEARQAWPNSPPTRHTFNPANDTDYARFTAVAGAVYTLTTVNLFGGADTVITLWHADGATRVARNDDDPTPWSGLASKLIWTAPASGLYYVTVHEFTGRTGCRGYELKIESTAQGTPVACTPYLLDTVATGSHPKGVAVADGRAFVGLHDTGALAVVDTAARAFLRTVPGSGDGANGVAIAGGRVWLAHRDSGNVSIFQQADPTGWQAARGVGPLPFGLGALADRVFVANYGSHSVSVMDSGNQTVIATTPAGQNPALIATGNDRAYITALEGGTGVQMVGRDGAFLGTLPTGAKPFGIAFDPQRQRLYVGHWGDNSLWIINPATGARIHSVTLADRPFALAVNPATGHLFVALPLANRLLVLDADTLAEVTTIPLPDQGGADGGQGIAVYDGRVYVSNYGAGSLSIVQDAACP